MSSMIGYITLTYVPRDSPRRSVHLAVRAWDDFLETAARAGLTRRDRQGDEPAAVRDRTGWVNPFDISIYIELLYIFLDISSIHLDISYYPIGFRYPIFSNSISVQIFFLSDLV